MQFIRAVVGRCLAIVALVMSGSAAIAPPASAGPATPESPALAAPVTTSAPARSGGDCGRAPAPRRSQWLDGFLLRWVPSDVGALVTDFEYEWEDVAFRSRVWESGPDADGAYRVDLQVTVLRAPTLTDPAALRAFLAEYLEHDPAEWVTEPFAHPDGPGFRDEDELFWLAAPGTAVRVQAGEQVGARGLERTACSVRQVLGPR